MTSHKTRGVAIGLSACAFSVALVAVEVLRIYLIVYHHVEAWRVKAVAWFVFYCLYIPDKAVVLLGSKPFLDYNSHHIGFGNEWTAMALLTAISSLFYFGVFILLRAVWRPLLSLRRSGSRPSGHAR